MEPIFHSSLNSIFRSWLCSMASLDRAWRISYPSFILHSRSKNQSFNMYLVPSPVTVIRPPSLFLRYRSALRLPLVSSRPKTSSSNSRRLAVPRYSFKSLQPWSVSQIQEPRPFLTALTSISYCSKASTYFSFIHNPSTLLSHHI